MNPKYEVKIGELSSGTIAAHLGLSKSQYKRNEITSRNFLIWKFLESTAKPYKIIEVWNKEMLFGRIALEPKKYVDTVQHTKELYLLTDLVVMKGSNDPRILFLLAAKIKELQSNYDFLVFPNQKSEYLYQKYLGYKKIGQQDFWLVSIFGKRKFLKKLSQNRIDGRESNARPVEAGLFKRTITDFERRFTQVPNRKYIFHIIPNPDGVTQTVIVFRRIYRFINLQVDLIIGFNLDQLLKIKSSKLPCIFVAPKSFLEMLDISKGKSGFWIRIPTCLLPHEFVGYGSTEGIVFGNNIQLSDIDVF